MASPARTCTPHSAVTFTVPAHDSARFAQLPEAARRDLRRTLIALQNIHRSARVLGLARASLAEAAKCFHTRGFTAPSLRRKYYAYLHSGGDWTAVVDRAKAGPAWWQSEHERRLPAAFIEFWRALCERNQRKCKPAHRELLRILRTGLDSEGRVYRQIPGYPEMPVGASYMGTGFGPTGEVPSGWSYENLQRHAPDDFALAAARQGRFAASHLSRQVFKTRAGLAVGQFYIFDDQEYDLKVNFPGSRKAMRPLGLNVLDLFSAHCFAYGLKPTLVDDLTGAKQKLKEIDMLWLVVHVLTAYGFNPDCGTTLVVENGTAAIRPDFEERITLVTGGQVKVSRAGMTGRSPFAALFDGRGKGNPRFKAPLESFFNLVRNEFAMLPGATGKDRDHCPDELAGRDRYNEQILRAAALLPADAAAQLRLPIWTWQQFVDFALIAYQRIESRTDHDLEGWEKAGLVTQEVCLDGQWLQLNSLPNSIQSAIRIGPSGTDLRTRRLSPREAFNRGATQLQPVSSELLPDLLGPDLGQVRTVRGAYITIEDQEIDSAPMRFNAPAGLTGEVRIYLNPFNPSHCVAATVRDNKFLAILPRQATPSWADLNGIQREIGAAKHDEAQRLQAIGLRHADRAAEKRDLHRHNAAVLAGKPVSPKQQAEHSRILEETDATAFRELASQRAPAPVPADDQPISVDELKEL